MNETTYTLEHHGIEGQRWGRRRFQNEDGSLTPAGRERYGYGPLPNERTILPAGTRLNSISSNPDSESYRQRDGWMYTYNPNDSWDSSVYKGPFSVYKSQLHEIPYDHSYEVVKDLKMPTSTDRFDEYVKLYQSNKDLFTRELQTVQNAARKYDLGPHMDAAKSIDLNSISSDRDLVATYRLFNNAMEDVSRFESTKRYADLMATKYDAMVDDNNQGIYNDTNDPIIVFKANEVLRTAAPVELNQICDIGKNFAQVREEMIRRGKEVGI